MNTNYRVESADDTNRLIEFLEDKLYEYNSSVIKEYDGQLFSRIVKNEDGTIVAGIAGWTWAGVCEITQLWVDEKKRNKDLGTLLLNAAEDEAASRGCLRLLIKTYSFQALDFYLKRGFQIEHIIVDFPVGYNYCIMSKRLVVR